MSDETFLGQRRFLWLWVSALGLLLLTAVYRTDHPIGGSNGGTRLGSAYGVLALAGIVFLMWYGVRRRYSYAAGSGTLKGWLGAHVWIGVSLAFVVPMHTGLRFDWNVHAVSYVLMLLTIASGIWGAWAYARYPSRLRTQTEGVTNRVLIERFEKLARSMVALTAGKSDAFAAFAKQLDVAFRPSLVRLVAGLPYRAFLQEDVRSSLARVPAAEYEAGLELASLAHDAHRLRDELVHELGMAARMRVWLYLHVPLSFACVLAVAAHIYWVAFYGWSVR